MVIAENKRVIQSLAEKGDNQAQCQSSMAEWIQDMKNQILKLQVKTINSYYRYDHQNTKTNFIVMLRTIKLIYATKSHF